MLCRGGVLAVLVMPATSGLSAAQSTMACVVVAACSTVVDQHLVTCGPPVMTCMVFLQEEYMDKAKLLLSKASRKLTVVTKQSRSWLMLYVLLFCIGLFAFVFIMNKLRRVGKLFFWH